MTLIRRVYVRPDRPAADAGGGRRVRDGQVAATLTRRSSTGCWPRRTTASGWRCTGSTWSATPTRSATTATTRCNVSPYRDYVIHAFNTNKPFDRFTVEQLAGDLLPNATTEQKVASAYNRLLQTTEEGGAQPKEYEREVRRRPGPERLDGLAGGDDGLLPSATTTSSTRSRRRTSTASAPSSPTSRRPPSAGGEPGMPVPDAAAGGGDQEARRGGRRRKEEARHADDRSWRPPQAEWEKSAGGTRRPSWTPLVVEKLSAANGTKLAAAGDGLVRASDKVPAKEIYILTAKTDAEGDHRLSAGGPGR